MKTKILFMCLFIFLISTSSIAQKPLRRNNRTSRSSQSSKRNNAQQNSQSALTVKDTIENVPQTVTPVVSNNRNNVSSQEESRRRTNNVPTAEKPRQMMNNVSSQEERSKTNDVPSEDEPRHRSLSDPSIVRYFKGGYAKDNTLYLYSNTDYCALDKNQKQLIINKLSSEFPDHNVRIMSDNKFQELWICKGTDVVLIDNWISDNLDLASYRPLELQRSGPTKFFYYIGSTYSGSEGYNNGMLNLRTGTYLYKNLVDVSLTLNLGYNSTNDDGDFAGDVGLDSRIYLPLHIKKFNFSPYLGGGVSWAFAPDSYSEFRFLAGGCWFVGPGSLDIGFQYGTESEWSVSLGYTFRIPYSKKKK